MTDERLTHRQIAGIDTSASCGHRGDVERHSPAIAAESGRAVAAQDVVPFGAGR